MVTGFIIVGAILTGIRSCSESGGKEVRHISREPAISPDYSGVTIPPNIAPLNFIVAEAESSYRIQVESSGGYKFLVKTSNNTVRFSMRNWKKLLSGNAGGNIMITISGLKEDGQVIEYSPILIDVADHPVDPFLSYRLLYPGYETWGAMKIVQRSTESFKEYPLVENQLLDNNCINCHTFKNHQPDTFFIHTRGSRRGTYFAEGKDIKRKELSIGEMPGNAVYPAWHPSGEVIVFSSNAIFSVIHMFPAKNVEMYDRTSILTMYNLHTNEMSVIPEDDSVKYMGTLPAWAPDGKHLYYCRAKQVGQVFDYREVFYELVRKPFDPETKEFGKTELVFSAGITGKSISSPTVSPDNRYVVFTLHDYGSFSNWHKEADLYLLRLENGQVDSMTLNSDEAETFHCWSSNGKWIVFSSKRDDGFHSRLYFAYFNGADSIGKPFILPQKDPGLHKQIPMSFNLPALMLGRSGAGPREFRRASRKKTTEAVWID